MQRGVSGVAQRFSNVIFQDRKDISVCNWIRSDASVPIETSLSDVIIIKMEIMKLLCFVAGGFCVISRSRCLYFTVMNV